MPIFVTGRVKRGVRAMAMAHNLESRSLANYGQHFADCVQNERHSYEKCQYEEFKLRVVKMEELKAARDGARTN
jgi:hypothetical protein